MGTQPLIGADYTDPTKNVEDLVKREVLHLKEMADLREQNTEFISNLRAEHSKELRQSEKERVDAIRNVDVTNATKLADGLLAAVKVLADTTARDAENLRNTLNTTAERIAKQLSDTVADFQKRISNIEQLQSEGRGKEKVADPQMSEFFKDIKDLIKAQSSVQGKDDWVNKVVPWIIAAGAILYEMFKPK